MPRDNIDESEVQPGVGKEGMQDGPRLINVAC